MDPNLGVETVERCRVRAPNPQQSLGYPVCVLTGDGGGDVAGSEGTGSGSGSRSGRT